MSEEYTPTIEREELAPGVFVYKNVIPGHHQLIPYIEQVVGSGMANWEAVSDDNNYFEKMVFDYPKEFKDPNDFSVQFEERIALVAGGFLGVAEKNYLGLNQLPRLQHDDLVLLKFEAGKYFPPSEINYKSEEDSAVVVLYYLNEDYTGSALTFPNLNNLTYTPKENEAIIFPAAEGFEYSISELTEGTKYAVMSYMRIKGRS